MKKIDKKNIAIIKQLQEGRRPYKAIADNLGLSENTVRTRVNQMLEDGTLTISGLVDPDALTGHSVVIIGVKLATMDLVAKGKEFKNLRGVVSAVIVTGRYDLILTVLLKEGFELIQFYTDEVSRIDDVQSVETFVVYKGFNFQVPYVL